MREAVVEAKLAVRDGREALARTQRELGEERQRLADAERRGRLAAEIQDAETVEVARRFAAKHGERVGVLDRKLAALTAELALSERELAEMQAQLARAERARPATDVRDELLKAEMDRAAREAAADRQLKELKKKMKKD